MKKMYVTFNDSFIEKWDNGPEWKTEKYAIPCDDKKELLRNASEVYCVEGLERLRLNKCGRIGKERKVITIEEFRKRY